MQISWSFARICLGILLAAVCEPFNSAVALGSVPDAMPHVTSTGSYSDKTTGATHLWQINEAHALVWDGSPYLPVGGTFTPKSFGSTSPNAWDADVKALSTLKTKGIHDLIIWPNTSLPDISSTSLQRLIDWLDKNGFRYGLSFGQGMTAPLTGLVVHPAVYRYEEHEEITAKWKVSNTDRALFFLADAGNEGKLFRIDEAIVRDGMASAPLEAPATVSRPVALLVPHKSLPVGSDNSLPNVWNDFDNYRDRVLSYLQQIKLGPGFRFFLDPLVRHLGISGEANYLIPESENFRLEWESYLKQNYNSADEVKNKWLLADDFKSLSELARLVPLWTSWPTGSSQAMHVPERGLAYMYDPTTGKSYRTLWTESSRSRWWNDFLAWRDQSLNYYMNAMADVLKRQVADVPVIYTWTQVEAMFSNTSPKGGFDGLAIATGAEDTHRLVRTSGPAFSQTEQSARTQWYLATEITDSASVSPQGVQPVSKSGVYTSQNAMDADLTDIRNIGVKGLYVRALQSDSPTDVGADWLNAPESIDWLSSYSKSVEADAKAAQLTPKVLYYPQQAPGPARTGLVPGTKDVYWLPANVEGSAVDWWPSFAGYTMRMKEDGPQQTVLVSLGNSRKTRVYVPDASKVTAVNIEGVPIPLKRVISAPTRVSARSTSKTAFEVTLDATPIIFSTDGQELIPEQAAVEALNQFAVLTEMAVTQKTSTADEAKLGLDAAYQYFQQMNFAGAWATSRQKIDVLTADVKPFIWMEGEENSGSNFTEVVPNANTSHGGYLRLATPDPPHKSPNAYAALFNFEVPADGDYKIWIACSLPGPETSPFTWYVDNRPEQEALDLKPQGPTYAGDHFGWFTLGTLKLVKSQQHTLRIKIVDRAKATNLYYYAIDTVMIVPITHTFIPNGIERPTPIDPDEAKKFVKKKIEQPTKGHK